MYFLVTSVTPFLFLLALFAGSVDLSEIIPQEYFSSVSPVINYLQQSARSAAGGAGVLLALTSLWSSTNFFYHLRRSGEIIFAPKIKINAVKLRVMSLLAVFGIIIVLAIIAAAPFIGGSVLNSIMPAPLAEAITSVFVLMFSYLAAYFLNAFGCPLKLGFEGIAEGANLTMLLWIACSVGFGIYLNYANPQKLYGAIAVVIVFLLWCYLMVNSVVLGLIHNARHAECM